MKRALVIGAGPAGLMAAEELARAGLSVTVAEQKPSPARKFLMAGKSGLNITKDEPLERFIAAFDAPRLRPMLEAFGPEDVKASPLLRAWLGRLDGLGVSLKTRWKWLGGALFGTPEGRITLDPDVTVLACGGASWARLGSDGAWAAHLNDIAPFQPANMGFLVNWSDHMQPHMGTPVKSVRLVAGGIEHRGEFVISSRGVEGGGIYAVSKAMREGAELKIDLLPDMTLEVVELRLKKAGKQSVSNALKRLGLDPVKRALFFEFSRNRNHAAARLLKALPVKHEGPRPLDEAISVAGGLKLEALNDSLMMKACPGIFAAGEMLDWEAPTGGYLITGCLATGRWAGRAAAQWASAQLAP